MKSIYQRIKGKKIRDFLVYGKRKYYLAKVKRAHKKHGEKFFFTEKYLKKHIVNYNIDQLVSAFIKSEMGLFDNVSRLKGRLKKLQSENPDLTKKIVEFSKEIIKHDFNLLGSGVINLDYPANPSGIFNVRYDWESYREPKKSRLTTSGYKEIDWHIDFKSGYRWNPDLYYPDSRSYFQTIGADIKIPWELSRCQHLPMVGLAYLITDEQVYAEEVYSQIIDWINNNSLCKGPNWNCPMDVGIRLANWLVALETVKVDNNPLNNERLKIILPSIVQHIDYLWNNFEWTSKLTSNHYLSDIAGFLFGIIYIPGLKKERQYTKFITEEFEKEIKKQMYSDGMNSEGSLPYHRLVLELFSYSAILAKNNGFHFNKNYYKQLKKSFKFTSVVMTKNFELPQIGDNDSGLFLRFFPRELGDMGYLNSLSNYFSNDLHCKTNDGGMVEHVLFSISCKNLEQKDSLAFCFKESGLAILKDDNIYLSFYNGANGQNNNGGHCHNDRNSITLIWKGRQVLGDPGTGCYTSFPNIRNKFRSTASHNTVSVSGSEQNRFYDNGYLFGITPDVTEHSISLLDDEKGIVFEGKHNGYEREGVQEEHKRIVNYSKENVVTITDELSTSTSSGGAYFLIPFSEDIFFSGNKILSPGFSFDFENYVSISVDKWDFSPSYGVNIKDYYIRVCAKFKKKLITRIRLL